MKHFYQNIPGWSRTVIETHTLVIKELPKNSHIVEVGILLGRSTAFLAVECFNSKKNITVDAIDDYAYNILELTPDELIRQFTNNVEPAAHLFSFKRKESILASMDYADGSLDYVYLDGGHKYDHVKREIKAWLPKLKKKGIIGGHDYGSMAHPGVKQAVSEYWQRSELQIISPGGGSSWLKRLS